MILFFDTSSLVKFFHNEEGTKVVTDLLNFQENEIWVSELARLEFVSALHRRFRNKEIDENILNEAKRGMHIMTPIYKLLGCYRHSHYYL